MRSARRSLGELAGRGSLRIKLAVGLAAALGLALALVFVFAANGESDAEAASHPCGGDLQRDYECFEEYLVEILEEQGAEASLARLDTLKDEDAYVQSQCHQFTHSIGRAALIVYGSVGKANEHGDGTCWSGYFHGVFEKYMIGFSDEELIAEMNQICQQDPNDPYNFDYYNCVHGVGHGVAWHEDNNVFDALPICDALEGSWEQNSCYSGVFMQNIIVDGRMHQSVNLKEDDPVYPCNAVDEPYKRSCYLGQTSYILRQIDYDYAEGFRICEGIDADYVETCYRSMGRDISGNSHREAAKVVELCSLGRPDLQDQCYAGAAKNAVYHDHGTANADVLCNLVPARYAEGCREARDEAARTL